ncbi:hypothetical protein D3C85_1091150 [compost metagenome]
MITVGVPLNLPVVVLKLIPAGSVVGEIVYEPTDPPVFTRSMFNASTPAVSIWLASA